VITLKYVANLKIDAIARALGMTVDGIDKLLSRAKQKIREERILLELPPLSHLSSRLPIVHKIIYLIYNEGYKSSSGKEILNEELCEEALLINKALLDSRNGDKDTAALHALMLFNAARFRARFGISGEMLDLEEQDRSLWNKELIMLACEFLQQSVGQPVSTYHYEASIAYLHCSASSFHSTNWTLISNLYQQILKISPNPFVELNYAIALYYSGEKIKALEILNALREQAFLNQYYLLNLTLGKIYLLEDNRGKAMKFFLRADGQTNSRIEKEYIQKMISRVKE
jgi:RNA polymerase sigma-70 factor (ECF subfamily)